MNRDSRFEPERFLSQREWVVSLARQLLKNEQDAEDAAQDAWVQAVRDPPRTLSAWLSKVVRNFSLQRARSERARKGREQSASKRERLPSAHDVMERAEIHRRVVEAVLALKEPWRTSVLLRFFDGLPPRRIAEHMNVQVSTVHTRLRRGLQALREELRSIDPGRSWYAIAAGATLMSLKTKSLIAAAILIAATWSVWWSVQTQMPESTGKETVTSDAYAATPPSVKEVEINPEVVRSADSPSSFHPSYPTNQEEANRLVFLGETKVCGRVVDEEGTPIEGAEVTLSLPDEDDFEHGLAGLACDSWEEWQAYGFQSLSLQPPVHLAFSNDEGRFEISNVRAGLAHALEVEAVGFGH